MVDILEFVVDITLKWLIFYPNLSELVLAMRERKHPHVHAETSACIGKKSLEYMRILRISMRMKKTSAWPTLLRTVI